MPIPNTFIAGVNKCATTTLHNVLIQSPEISGGVVKESLYFIRDYWKGKEYLESQFPEDNKIILDAHPNNSLIGYVPDRIEETCGFDTNIIIVVREPISRMYSDICHFQKMRPGREVQSANVIASWNLNNYVHEPFINEFEYMNQADPRGGCYRPSYLERGVYSRRIEGFKKFNLKVVLFEDLVCNPSDTVASIADFLKVKRFPYTIKKMNSKSDSKGFSPEIYNELRTFYKQYNDELSQYLNTNLEQKWYESNNI